MRLVIDPPAYAAAADAFTTAHQVAAIQYDALVALLGSFGGMAGDDSTSAAFAAAYDDTAAEALRALADLVPAFANLGRLAGRSAANHRTADTHSILGGSVVFDGTWLPDDEVLSVLPATAPSSLGGDPPGFSEEENWILDHIEGFVWPNADTHRLLDAARVWRSAATSLDGLTAHCHDAVGALEQQRSPEIPLAVAARHELAAAIGDVAEQLAALATSCDEYAAQVDARREEIRALLREILQMVVEGLLVSAAIGLITGGAGAVAGTSAVVARVAAQAPRFAAILAVLRAAVASSAASLRATHAAVAASRLRLAKFVNARMALRNELGHWRFEDDALAALRAWEVQGHAVERHVAQSLTAMRQRIQHEPWLTGVSTFSTEGAAARTVHQLLVRNRGRIENWLRGADHALVVDARFTETVGEHLSRAGDLSRVHGARAYLVRDSTWPDGFRVHTAYPVP
jgi:hypothetical protein